MNNKNLEIANTIIQQLGGTGRLVTMVGAWNFQVEDNSVSFRFKGSKIANYVKIILDALDTYNVEFKLINTPEGICEEKEKFSMIYNDMLVNTFEEYTGLYLSL